MINREINKKNKFTKSALGLVVVLALFIISNLFAPLETSATINKQINYQGKLTTPANVGVTDGSYNVIYKLYTVSSGGSALWTERFCYSPDAGVTCNGTGTDKRVVVTNGLFSTMLGSVTSLVGVDFNQTLYLGVTVSGSSTSLTGEAEMTPRKIIGSVPSAFVADTLQGLTPSNFFRTDYANGTSSTSTYLSVTNIGTGKIADFMGLASSSVFSILSNGNINATSTMDINGTVDSSLGFYTNGAFFGMATGTRNYLIGANTRATTTANTGTDNFFAGNLAGQTNTTGNYNNFIGSTAGHYNTTGSNNNIFGTNSGFSNTTGNDNNFFGTYSGGSNTTGGSNVFIGNSSGYNNISGGYNIAFGPNSLYSNSTSSNNVALGFDALYSVTGGGNVGIGNRAGQYETGSNSFYVDNQDRTNIAGGKTGALLYGTFNATAANQTLTINASTTIAQNLSVLGTGSSYFMGNVGIGTTSPARTLDVNGDIATNGHIVLGSKYSISNPSALSFGYGADNGLGLSSSRIALYEYTGNSYFYGFGLKQNSNSVWGLGFWGGTGSGTADSVSPNIFLQAGGNVGIGTTTPSEKLSVIGNILASGTILGSNFTGTSTGINTGNITLGTGNGLSLVGQALSLALASTTGTGALSSTDWNVFNGKLSTTTASSTYVSYTGANADVNLGSHAFTTSGTGSFGDINSSGALTFSNAGYIQTPVGLHGSNSLSLLTGDLTSGGGSGSISLTTGEVSAGGGSGGINLTTGDANGGVSDIRLTGGNNSGGVGGGITLAVGTGSTGTGTINITGSIIPTASTYDLGSASYGWANAYTANIYGVSTINGGAIDVHNTLDMGGNTIYNSGTIIPNSSGVQDLGGGSNYWNGVYATNVFATSFIKPGGTSGQFLKADGTVDSSTYLTTATGASTYVPYSGATGAVNLNNKALSNLSTLSVGSTTAPTGGVAYFNGNVGIGTASPSQLLSVGASNQFTVNSSGNASTTGSGRFDAGLGVGTAAVSTTGVNVSLSGSKTGFAYTNSGVPDAATAYGLKNTITTSMTYDPTAYGVYNNLTINGLPDMAQAKGYGMFNTLSISGTSALGYGQYNSMIASGSGTKAYGSYNGISSSGANNNQTLYGSYNSIMPNGTGVTAYGDYTANAGTINDPTVDQMGVYVGWNGAGTDVNNKKWAIYNGSTNTTAGKVFLGLDNTKTYWGTGYDGSIYYDGTNLNINPKEVGTGSLNILGNVGIGSTTPISTLAVKGTAGTNPFTISSSTDAVLLTLLSSGNLGVGTSTPQSLLTVAGTGYFTGLLTAPYINTTSTTATSTFAGPVSIAYCVTGDTKIRRRKRKTATAGGNDDEEGEEGNEYDYEDVPIKEIGEGDEVESYDEDTQSLVFQKVRSLYDMGVQEIWQIETAHGFNIRTTSEHPYYVRLAKPVKAKKGKKVHVGKWTKVKKLAVGDTIAVIEGPYRNVGWDTIAKISILPVEQVYDLEISETHNFVGNCILAHNTFLANTASIGTAFNTNAGTLKISQTGTGAVIIGDTSGNARGGCALDVQSYRSATSQVGGCLSSVFGNSNTAAGCYSSAFGSNNDVGTYGTAVGYCNTAGADGVVLGCHNCAYAGSTAVGQGNCADGYYTTAVGFLNHACGTTSSAFGYCNCACDYAVAVGNNVNAGYGSAVFGSGCAGCISICGGCLITPSGCYFDTYGCYSGYVGTANTAYYLCDYGYSSCQCLNYGYMGICTYCSCYACYACCAGCIADCGSCTYIVGCNNSNGSYGCSSAFGTNNTLCYYGASAFGYGNSALSSCSTSVGACNCSGGGASQSFGWCNFAGGYETSAIGVCNQAINCCDSAFGHGNCACGNWSSAFGITNFATSTYASAFGLCNYSAGSAAQSFGWCNVAGGYESSAIGVCNVASNGDAFGRCNNVTNGEVFGYCNSALNSSSAFGYANCAIGVTSSAFGFGSCAVGNCSVAFGNGVCVSAAGAAAFGSSYAGCIYLTGNKVGIGSTTPISTLSVKGIAGTNPFTIASSTNSTLFTVLSNGNVGIGTSTPSSALTVNGDINFVSGATRNISMNSPVNANADTLMVSTAGGNGDAKLGGGMCFTTGAGSAGGSSCMGGCGGWLNMILGDGASDGACGTGSPVVAGSGGGFRFSSGNGAAVLHNGAGAGVIPGNGGCYCIYTGSGGAATAVTSGLTTGMGGCGGNYVLGLGNGGSVAVGKVGGTGGAGSFTGGTGGSSIASGSGTNTGGVGGGFSFSGGTGGCAQNSTTNNGGAGGAFTFTAGFGGAGIGGGTSGAGGNFIINGGTSGVTDAPSTKGKGGSVYIMGGAIGSGGGSGGTAGNVILGMNSAGAKIGNVGIGTSTPGSLLDVYGTTTAQTILPYGPFTGNMSAYNLGSSTARWNSIWAGTVNIGTSTWSLTQTNGRLSIFDAASGAGNERLSILANGNVGFGTASPSAKLDVVGDFELKQATTLATIMGDVTGDARGSCSLDLQSYRSAATQVASGGTSAAVGLCNLAGDGLSSAFGIANCTGGNANSAFGYGNCTSNDNGPSAFGYNNRAMADFSSAFGNTSYACGNGSSAFGYSNCANGGCAVALGAYSCACYDCSVAVGIGAYASNYGTSVFGSNYSGCLCLSGGCLFTPGGCYFDCYGNYSGCSQYSGCACCSCYSCYGYCSSCAGCADCSNCSNYAYCASAVCSPYGNYIYDGGGYWFIQGDLLPTSQQNLGTSGNCWGCVNACYYYGDGSNLTGMSDINKKTNFVDLNKADILAKIDALDLRQWSYKTSPTVNHIGPFAQDFSAAFGLGNSTSSISFIDPAGVALVGVQGLSAKLSAFDASTTATIADLKLQLADIQSIVGLSTTTGTSSVSNLFGGSLIDSFASYLQSFGAQVVDGVVHFAEVVVNKITVSNLVIKNEANVFKSGYTIYDRATGQPICVFFENGVQKTTPGDCDTAEAASTTNTTVTTTTTTVSATSSESTASSTSDVFVISTTPDTSVASSTTTTSSSDSFTMTATDTAPVAPAPVEVAPTDVVTAPAEVVPASVESAPITSTTI